MEKIHVGRGGTKLGEYTADEIRAGLASGQFLPTDLAWKPGMADWQPIGNVIGVPDGSVPPPIGVIGGGTAALIHAGDQPAWEQREKLGFFPAILSTIKMVLTKPAETFAAMKKEGGLGTPLLYGMIVGIPCIELSVIYQSIFEMLAGTTSSGMPSPLISIFAAPIFLLIFVPLGLLIGAGITHLSLMLLGAKGTFETTFRVTAYAYGSSYALSIVPFCGGMVGGIWGIVASIIGYSKAHNITTGKAALAVFLPGIVCCVLIVILLVIFGAAMGPALQEMQKSLQT